MFSDNGYIIGSDYCSVILTVNFVNDCNFQRFRSPTKLHSRIHAAVIFDWCG